jgi:hypothetical protein
MWFCGNLMAKAELGRPGKKSLCTLQERLHVRSLHVWSSKRFLAVPLLNEQEAIWIVDVLLEANTMASGLIRHYRVDDVSEFLACQVHFIGEN